MGRTKKLPNERIVGVTYSAKDKRVLRVQLGRKTVIDIEKHTATDIVGRSKYQVSAEDATKLARQAKRWLKPPKGSILIR